MSRFAAALLILQCGALAYAAGSGLPAVVEILAGLFIAGSDRAERELAYALDAVGYSSAVTREQRWYDGERAQET